MWRRWKCCKVSRRDGRDIIHTLSGAAGASPKCLPASRLATIGNAFNFAGGELQEEVLEATVEPGAADEALVCFELWREVRRRAVRVRRKF